MCPGNPSRGYGVHGGVGSVSTAVLLLRQMYTESVKSSQYSPHCSSACALSRLSIPGIALGGETRDIKQTLERETTVESHP